jgi:hypothetical protein
MRRYVCHAADRDQFEEGRGELDQTVLGAPGMPVAGAYLESDPLVPGRGSIEIVHGQH